MRRGANFYVIDGRKVIRSLVFLAVAALLIIAALHFIGNSGVTVFVRFLPVSGAIYRGPDTSPLMSLTFNVDWGTEHIPPILEILDSYDVQATFFLTGSWAAKFPEMARAIADHGHEIGNHGLAHDHPRALSDEGLRRLIAENRELLTERTGKETQLFAPPYGEVDRRVAEMAERTGHKTIMWTIDTIDWQDPSPETILNRITRNAQNGAIVLMHPKPNTVKALPLIIQSLTEMGFRLVTVGELLSSAQE